LDLNFEPADHNVCAQRRGCFTTCAPPH
jgi:hypothetical protein